MLDPTIASLNDIKGLTAAMREYTGRERALLGAGKPIEIEKRIEVADWRGRAMLAWERVMTIFPKSATPPAIAEAFNGGARPFLRRLRAGAGQGLPEFDRRLRRPGCRQKNGPIFQIRR